MVVHTCIPSTREIEVGELEVQDHPWCIMSSRPTPVGALYATCLRRGGKTRVWVPLSASDRVWLLLLDELKSNRVVVFSVPPHCRCAEPAREPKSAPRPAAAQQAGRATHVQSVGAEDHRAVAARHAGGQHRRAQ